jgi:hypothetical protein
MTKGTLLGMSRKTGINTHLDITSFLSSCCDPAARWPSWTSEGTKENDLWKLERKKQKKRKKKSKKGKTRTARAVSIGLRWSGPPQILQIPRTHAVSHPEGYNFSEQSFGQIFGLPQVGVEPATSGVGPEVRGDGPSELTTYRLTAQAVLDSQLQGTSDTMSYIPATPHASQRCHALPTSSSGTHPHTASSQ